MSGSGIFFVILAAVVLAALSISAVLVLMTKKDITKLEKETEKEVEKETEKEVENGKVFEKNHLL